MTESLSPHNLSPHQAALSPHQAAAEAGRCLWCHDAPCVKGCPAGVDVPAFVKKVWSGNWRGAARVIREANVFGGTCARVCPTEELCEKECSSRLLGRAIPIGALQALACELGGLAAAGEPSGAASPVAESRPATRGAAQASPASRSAAIVGAGPAGLAAAWELRRQGWDVTVYEAADRPGGQLTWTIPPYRLPAEVVAAEVDAILALGVTLRTGAWVDRRLADSLLASNDAVILAAGLGEGRGAGIEGEDRPGVVKAETFLAEARQGAGKKGAARDLSGRKVIVAGGGNTAMDAAVTAARSGAQRVTVIYRRSAREMPAWPREYQGALAAGVEFLWLAQPVAFEGPKAGSPVNGVKCVRMSLGRPDASGRAAPQPVPGSEFRVEADFVILALGQGPNEDIIEAFGLAADKTGRPVLDASGRATPVSGTPGSGGPRAKVFVAGDLASGGATVVRAVAEGKKVAREVASL